ncbi:ABC transporter ATP-binding protein [Dethiosulfovibrio acidaminovorans]|uniref:ABC transporter ATP-binding protein n=2 Tax=Dethiosulfovibrio TaxID=47054 RepID=A0ABS9ENH2_9BACT|nr:MULTISPECIES: ABC transporter ATP-binding protein [Dethiosulfovibrio]MCF4114073.1 ABC transporter ATP-binding protein [Dethiosulfovibrio russensis]MCF4142737.1 ABC transporter ATP-binding protein [Dethiosulfovibrio marinus]MCF4144699.1 ABC transporter ATP-binding protein [Dethiosulfovibrio acidaminovorans]
MAEKILEVKDLSTWFYTEEGIVKALEKVSFSIGQGEILGIVGETGCGKSVTSRSIMGLIPQPPGKIVEGQVLFQGRDLLTLPDDEMRSVRGCDMAMIFQDPMSSLNPVLKVGFQVEEAIKAHGSVSDTEARSRALEMFRKVNIPDPEKSLGRYPHQFSGGMKQRVMIAMALCCNPKLLIADEPTTALDVSIQAQILSLIKALQRDFGSSIMLISHDLGVIATMAQKVAVMYAGSIIEYGTVNDIFDSPLHPYTKGLIGAIPRLDRDQERLDVIKGSLPNLIHLPEGCKFRERCPMAEPICATARPPRITDDKGHEVACYAYR